MKKDHKKSVINAVSLFVLLFLVTGCADLTSYQSQVAEHTSTFLPRLDQDLIDRKLRANLEHETSLSFREACLQAAMVDVKLVELLAGLEKSKINVESAASNIWPRLDMRLKAELATADSDGDSVEPTGGIFIRYDIVKALTSGDEKAIREAYVLKDIVNIKLAVNRLAQKLYTQMARISSAEFTLQKRKEILDMTRKTLALAHIYGEQKRIKSEIIWQWEANVDRQNVNVLQAEQELLVAERTFNGFLGLSGATKIAISDKEPLLGEDLIVDHALPSASTIWSQHGQARLAEINAIAAEANLKLAKISGWPQVTADFGVGSIPLSTQSDTSDSVVTLSVQMPLIDMGDHRRKVAEAAITLDFVKTGLEKVAEMLWINGDNAFLRYRQTQKHYRYITALYDKVMNEQNEKKKLYEENYIDTLDVVPQRIQLMEIQIQTKEAGYRVQEAAIEYNLAVGNDFRPEFGTSLLNDLLAKRLFVQPE